MIKMSILCFCFMMGFAAAYGHQGKLISDDGNLQADLMPQELNPAFPDKDSKLMGFAPIYFSLSSIQNLASRVSQLVLNNAEQDSPWSSILPLPRSRRSGSLTASSSTTDVVEPLSSYISTSTTSIAEQVKQYSRIVACLVLVVSSIIEIVLYVIESYQVNRATLTA